MINKEEIKSIAKQLNLPVNTIEKDYILGWILSGIFHVKAFKESWIFKGGTCLKKCFFDNYRFSEDLDFTLLDESHIDEVLLVRKFSEVSDWVYELTGIEIPQEFLRFKIYKNPREKTSIEGRLYYRGPMQRGGDPSRIKLDLTTDEKIVCQTEKRKIYHGYSDCPSDGMYINSYSLEEIFAEKMRALIERLRPRDLYDVINLFSNWNPNREIFLNALREKCVFKKVEIPTLELIENSSYKKELVEEWKNMLGHQVGTLDPFESYWNRLSELFNWMYSES